jgi:4a-hydroxytetrahydrobiopterin dehydratase
MTTSSLTLTELAAKTCGSCEDAKPMSREESEPLLRDLPGWELTNGAIEKWFRFKSYSAGLEFSYAFGRIAEEQDHHPDMLVGWRRVKVTLSTHVIKGLSMNDFIMAAKAELEYQKHSPR